jgi:hypothetical protein
VFSTANRSSNPAALIALSLYQVFSKTILALLLKRVVIISLIKAGDSDMRQLALTYSSQ